jgi:hypothetical protein
MRTSLPACLTVLGLVLLTTGCGAKDTSPRIVCNVDGEMVDANFTFEQFRKALEREHGSVMREDVKMLRSPHLQVNFEPQADGRLLAVRAVMTDDWQDIDPVVLFGLRPEAPLIPESDVTIEIMPTNRLVAE